jgi:excisionase family DNA binding protein
MSNERQLAEVRFLTVAEVASIMRVSKMTVYRMVHAGELPAIRVGRSFRVPEDAVHKYLRTSYVDTACLVLTARQQGGPGSQTRPTLSVAQVKKPWVSGCRPP